MKKLLTLIALLAASLTVNAQLSTNITIPAAGFTNLVPHSITVNSFTLTAPANNTASIRIVDSNTATNMYWTNAPYITRSQYVTNKITTWTNFFGVVNSITNLAVVQYTNTVSSTSNYWRQVMSLSALTNGSTFVDVSSSPTVFFLGLSFTNLGSGAATLSINYTDNVQ